MNYTDQFLKLVPIELRFNDKAATIEETYLPIELPVRTLNPLRVESFAASATMEGCTDVVFYSGESITFAIAVVDFEEELNNLAAKIDPRFARKLTQEQQDKQDLKNATNNFFHNKNKP